MNIFSRFLFPLVICAASNVQAMDSQPKHVNLSGELKITSDDKNKAIDAFSYTEPVSRILKNDLLLPAVIANKEVIGNMLPDDQKEKLNQVMEYINYCCVG